MNASPPPLPFKQKSRARWWIPALAIFGISVIAWSVYARDEAPPRDDDLLSPPLKLSDQENAYVQLSQVAGRLVGILDLSENEAALLEEMRRGENWDESKATLWLSKAAPFWSSYEYAAQIEASQAPLLISPETRVPEIGQIRTLGRLSLIRARQLLRADHPDDALNIVCIQLFVGKRMQESRGSIICYLTGVGLKIDALAAIYDIAAHPRVSSAALQQALAAIKDCRSSSETLANAFRSELRFYDGTVHLMRQEGTPWSTGHEKSLMHGVALRFPGLFKPNKTRRIYIDNLRVALRHIDSAAEDLEAYQVEVKAPNLFRPENIIGDIFLNIITPTWKSLIRSRHTEETSLSLHQATIAAILYQRETRRTFESLEELVPAYLEKVPADAHGVPIKYTKENRSITPATTPRSSGASHAPPARNVNGLVIPELR